MVQCPVKLVLKVRADGADAVIFTLTPFGRNLQAVIINYPQKDTQRDY